MRNKTRSFTVEYKAPRRRMRQEPSSIWRGIDLHKIANEAKADAEKLFRPSQVPEKRQSATVDPVRESTSHDRHFEKGLLDVAATDAVEPLVKEAPAAIEAADRVETIRSVKQGNTKRSRRPAPRRSPPKLTDTRTPISANEDLTVLQDENLRLKAAYRNKLITENVRLRQLLDRFRF